jgi:hypothetical protein
MRNPATLLLLLAILTVLAMLTACTSSRLAPSHEIFDEQSGMTLEVVSMPFIFARERSDVAAHARDYATLVAAEIDRSGEYSDFLLLYRWSTVDRRMSPPPPLSAGALRILADGRAIDLQPLQRVPISLTQSHALYVPPHGDVVPRAYAVDAALLRYIAACRNLTLRMPQEELNTPFTLWQYGREALAKFLQSVSGS